ncbi:MAG: preprotein translocase subunit SecY [Candidatus Marinimicrobia bacterium]|nr:preprotein translocase subunit SecY [Candidatus Neomarinimicrobiota bacterium]|tara:strand:+ start:1679 stop:3013 length:1335 start_codon:yes stop_codon:yes gene_type:complete
MIKSFINIFYVPELRKKLAFTCSLLLVYRLGGHVPVPGIERTALEVMMASFEGTILGLYDMFAGGFFSQASIFALGIMPYISASIIIQLLGSVVPYFQRLQKEGEEGRKKIIQLTRYGTVLIATLQAVGVAVFLANQEIVGAGRVVPNADILFYFVTIVTLVTGTVFVMWLGEKISDHGLGNGISLIIMVGILASAPHVFNIQLSYLMEGSLNPITQLIPSILLMVAITIFVVLVTTAVRKIPVQYAKRVVGRKVYGGQSTHLPLKILTAGVMPIIFAQALMFLPNTIGQLFQGSIGSWVLTVFSPDHWFYALVLSIFIIIFTYFYTAIAFNPVDVADNMKKQGGFIPGVRPGKPTADYIDNILTKVTLPAAIFLAFIACIPTFLVMFAGMDFSLASFYGGTSLLIIVGVALDTLQQIESHLITRHYDGFLKSGKIQGRSRKRY